MDWLQAVVMGIVQGLTEFLPISSTAHLRIVPALLGWKEPGSAFSAVIQCGTLTAVLAYFRQDLFRIGNAWTRETLSGKICQSLDGRLGWMMIWGTLPIAGCGLLFEKYIDSHWRSLYVISGSLIGLALLLAAAEFHTRQRQQRGLAEKELADVSWLDALIVGLLQAVALVPGSSRSGVTMTAGLFRGLSRETAARFSFLLSLPAIAAAGVYKLIKERDDLLHNSDAAQNLIIATVVSAVVGYISIAWLLKYLKSHNTYVFIVYRLVLGAVLLALLYNGTLAPNPVTEPESPPLARLMR